MREVYAFRRQDSSGGTAKECAAGGETESPAGSNQRGFAMKPGGFAPGHPPALRCGGRLDAGGGEGNPINPVYAQMLIKIRVVRPGGVR